MINRFFKLFILLSFVLQNCNAVIINNATGSKIYCAPIFKTSKGFVCNQPFSFETRFIFDFWNQNEYNEIDASLADNLNLSAKDRRQTPEARLYTFDQKLIEDFEKLLTLDSSLFALDQRTKDFLEKNKSNFYMDSCYCSQDHLDEWKEFNKNGMKYLFVNDNNELKVQLCVDIKDKEKYYWLSKALNYIDGKNILSFEQAQKQIDEEEAIRFLDATEHANIDVVKELIDRVNINVQNEDGLTPLMLAAGKMFLWSSSDDKEYNHELNLLLKNKEMIIKMLLKRGANKNMTDFIMRWTALEWAKHNGHESIIKLLE